jgi:tRNA-binding protein
MKDEITFEDFSKVDLRIGTIIDVKDFPKARVPAYQLVIDFGGLGIKNSSAQITHLYKKEDLLNKQIVAVVNFKKKQIANFLSECLVLGIYNKNKEVVLLQSTTSSIKNGEQVS